MMGTRQKLKTGDEVDFIFARGLCGSLRNNKNNLKHKIKRGLARRRRVESKNIVKQVLNE